jgi:hypothetical protein
LIEWPSEFRIPPFPTERLRHQREEDVGEVFRFLCGQNYKSASDGHESVALMHSRDSRTCIAEPLQMLLVLPLHFGNALADC